MIYVTVPKQRQATDATVKPKEDFLNFIEEIDGRRLSILRTDYSKFSREEKLQRFAGEMESVAAGDIVFHQSPVYMHLGNERLVLKHLKEKGACVIIVIHDLDYIRRRNDNLKYLFGEMLTFVDGIIVTSKKMQEQIVRDFGYSGTFVHRGPWDYLDAMPISPKKYAMKVHLTANITNTPFISKLPEGISWQVYGPGKKIELPEQVTYNGSFYFQELDLHMKEGFGLIWYGDEITDSIDSTGIVDYLEYIWPHKLSYYLQNGLPVIVHEKYYCADFVKKNNLGIVVHSLEEVASRIEELGEEGYQQMCNNCAEIGLLLKSGHFSKLACLEMIDKLKVKW